MPGVLEPGVITPVAGSIVKPAVELKLVPVKGPPVRTVTIGDAEPTLVQKGVPV